LDSSDDQEKQAQNDFRGCQIGACFACGLGGGNRSTINWQSSLPNPLPMFQTPNEFYTPTLLPGLYLPLKFMTREIDDDRLFYTLDNHELAYRVAAFLSHEDAHRYLLVGIVPILMRLLASRCYAIFPYFMKYGFHPAFWETLLVQSRIIRNFFDVTAPLHEVVANLRNRVLLKILEEDHGVVYDVKKPLDDIDSSLAYYNVAYGQYFAEVLSNFHIIIRTLEDWFAPNPIHSDTIITLAEFLLQGALNLTEMANDLFTAPDLVAKKDLPPYLKHFGTRYFSRHTELLSPVHLRFPIYTAYPITVLLEVITSGIQKAKVRRRKKSPETGIEQVLYIAKAIPIFHEWLQSIDILFWFKKRIFHAISDTQELLKGLGFDLPLVEAWHMDMSPYISIAIPDEMEGVQFCNFGRQRQHFREYSREILAREALSTSTSLIAFTRQSDHPVGMWYAPACDQLNRSPITPSVFILGGSSGEARHFVSRLFHLTIFESLREQIVAKQGITCPLRHQFGVHCCGRAGLVWSIYEAGLKAMDIKGLGWQPTMWIEPECSKPDNIG
jgi:hypothetical protein